MTRISLRPRAMDGLKNAANRYQQRINTCLGILSKGLFPPHTKKLGGDPEGYRTRVGRWRILFVLKEEEIDIVDIFLKKGDSGYRR